MELQGLKINVLGDSITEGVGTSSSEKGFVRLLEAKTGCICRNYGIPGTRIARQKHVPRGYEGELPDNHFCGRFSAMDDDADVILVFGGTNDFGHGDAPFGTMEDRTDDTFYGALHVLFRGLIEKYPEQTIVVMTPTHRFDEMWMDDRLGWYRQGTFYDYVRIIREVAEYYALPVLDLFQNSRMQPQVPVLCEKHMPDGLHPNDAGNEIIAGRIISFLKNL